MALLKSHLNEVFHRHQAASFLHTSSDDNIQVEYSASNALAVSQVASEENRYERVTSMGVPSPTGSARSEHSPLDDRGALDRKKKDPQQREETWEDRKNKALEGYHEVFPVFKKTHPEQTIRRYTVEDVNWNKFRPEQIVQDDGSQEEKKQIVLPKRQRMKPFTAKTNDTTTQQVLAAAGTDYSYIRWTSATGWSGACAYFALSAFNVQVSIPQRCVD